jgi:hypothetical protein
MTFKDEKGDEVRSVGIDRGPEPMLGFSAHSVELDRGDFELLLNMDDDQMHAALVSIASRLV